MTTVFFVLGLVGAKAREQDRHAVSNANEIKGDLIVDCLISDCCSLISTCD